MVWIQLNFSTISFNSTIYLNPGNKMSVIKGQLDHAECILNSVDWSGGNPVDFTSWILNQLEWKGSRSSFEALEQWKQIVFAVQFHEYQGL